MKPQEVKWDMYQVNASWGDRVVGSALNGGILGAIIGVAVGIGLIAMVVIYPPSILAIPTVLTGMSTLGTLFTFAAIGAGLGAIGGSIWTMVTNKSITVNDFLSGMLGYVGSILTFVTFIGGLMFVGFSPVLEVILPPQLQILVFLLTFPIWIVILLWVAGFILDVFKTIPKIISPL